MIIAWKIHWTDKYGQAAIEVSDRNRFDIIYQNIRKDPEAEDVWSNIWTTKKGGRHDFIRDPL